MATTVSVELKHTLDRVLAEMDRISRDVREQATVRALNKLAAQVKTSASREIREAGYNLKAATVKKQLTVLRATPARLVATVRASGKPIPLIEYGAKGAAKGGVRVKVKGKTSVLRHAFIATMPNGHVGVYDRAPGAKHKKGTQRRPNVWTQGPIKQLFGPGVPDALANASVQANIERLVQEKFAATLRSEVAYIVRR